MIKVESFTCITFPTDITFSTSTTSHRMPRIAFRTLWVSLSHTMTPGRGLLEIYTTIYSTCITLPTHFTFSTRITSHRIPGDASSPSWIFLAHTMMPFTSFLGIKLIGMFSSTSTTLPTLVTYFTCLTSDSCPIIAFRSPCIVLTHTITP